MNIVSFTRSHLEYKGFILRIITNFGCFGRYFNIIVAKDCTCIFSVVDQILKSNLVTCILN